MMGGTTSSSVFLLHFFVLPFGCALLPQPKFSSPHGSSSSRVLATSTDSVLVSEFASLRRICCNRELDMKDIKAVGFDMDYTLAQYNYEFDMLAFEGAKEKLIGMGYPKKSVLSFRFDPTEHRRGLVIDKALGNILKVDRHKYTRTAFHGRKKELSPAERKKAYVGVVADETPQFVGDAYVNVDSLFQLIDASLFAQVVDVIDDEEAWGGNQRPSYFRAYRDVRRAVDLCHHDGVIKDRVAAEPERYILPDDNLIPMLENFRLAGKKVFFLTNSLFDYSNVVMNFLTNSPVEGRDWLDLFDVVVVGAGKPAFLSPDARQREMLRVDVTTNVGTLHNLRGSPVSEIGAEKFLNREGKVFQGGGYKDLHSILDVDVGSQVLYVGDHIYGDVVRSKRSLGWRTALVVPELEDELRIATTQDDYTSKLVHCQKHCEKAEAKTDDILLKSLRAQKRNDNSSDHFTIDLEAANKERQRARDALRDLRLEINAKYHPTWGPMFRTGYAASRFAKQVLDYACIYTSRASNLGQCSPLHHFRPPADALPHDDQVVLTGGTTDED